MIPSVSLCRFVEDSMTTPARDFLKRSHFRMRKNSGVALCTKLIWLDSVLTWKLSNCTSMSFICLCFGDVEYPLKCNMYISPALSCSCFILSHETYPMLTISDKSTRRIDTIHPRTHWSLPRTSPCSSSLPFHLFSSNLSYKALPRLEDVTISNKIYKDPQKGYQASRYLLESLSLLLFVTMSYFLFHFPHKVTPHFDKVTISNKTFKNPQNGYQISQYSLESTMYLFLLLFVAMSYLLFHFPYEVPPPYFNKVAIPNKPFKDSQNEY